MVNVNEKLDQFLIQENDALSKMEIELGASVVMSGSISAPRKSYCVVEQTENYYIVKNGEMLEAIPVEQASIVAISIIR